LVNEKEIIKHNESAVNKQSTKLRYCLNS